MSIVFAGAPVVNALVSLWMTRNEIQVNAIHPLFYLGMAMALAGGGLVTLYKPMPPPPAKKASPAFVSPSPRAN